MPSVSTLDARLRGLLLALVMGLFLASQAGAQTPAPAPSPSSPRSGAGLAAQSDELTRLVYFNIPRAGDYTCTFVLGLNASGSMLKDNHFYEARMALQRLLKDSLVPGDKVSMFLFGQNPVEVPGMVPPVPVPAASPLDLQQILMVRDELSGKLTSLATLAGRGTDLKHARYFALQKYVQPSPGQNVIILLMDDGYEEEGAWGSNPANVRKLQDLETALNVSLQTRSDIGGTSLAVHYYYRFPDTSAAAEIPPMGSASYPLPRGQTVIAVGGTPPPVTSPSPPVRGTALRITSPSPSATMSPNFVVQASLTDADPDVEQAVLTMDGREVASPSTGSGPWSFRVEGAAEGEHSLQVRARKKGGVTLESDRVRVRVGPPPPPPKPWWLLLVGMMGVGGLAALGLMPGKATFIDAASEDVQTLKVSSGSPILIGGPADGAPNRYAHSGLPQQVATIRHAFPGKLLLKKQPLAGLQIVTQEGIEVEDAEVPLSSSAELTYRAPGRMTATTLMIERGGQSRSSAPDGNFGAGGDPDDDWRA